MAIIKEKVLPNGVTGNYWRITGIRVNKPELRVDFTIELFVAQANHIPIGGKKHFSFQVTREELAGDLMALGYTKIKARANSMTSNPYGVKLTTPVPGDADLAGGVDS